MVFQLLNGLNTQPDVDLFVILLNEGLLSDKLDSAGVASLVLDERKLSFLEITSSAVMALKGRAPQILHSHRYKENVLAYLVSRILGNGAILVSTQHGMPELYQAWWNPLQRLKAQLNFRLLGRKFDKIVAVSDDIKESLIRDYSFQEAWVETIRNGIDVPAKRLRTGAKHDFIIGSAGRFVPVKNFSFMVEVAKHMLSKTDEIRFDLAGEGPMFREIQDLVIRYGLEKRIILRGFVEDMTFFYNRLDIYLNTSLHEGVPMSVLEAMVRGIPIVAPRVGGLGEIVTDGIDGYLIDGRNPKDFAEKCLALYKNEALHRSMAYAAREKIIRQFSVERMVAEYLSVYAQAAKA